MEIEKEVIIRHPNSIEVHRDPSELSSLNTFCFSSSNEDEKTAHVLSVGGMIPFLLLLISLFIYGST